ncbi:MAG: autotransporter outer membrane beta-barrel domain-containing protein, partial [Verrucomicrobiota bacterium]
LQQASDSFSSGASTLLSAMTLTEMLALEERETAPKAENKFVADVIGFGSFAQQDATANRPESEYYLASATLRAGYRVNKDLTVGGYAGYNRTDADVDTLGSELEAQGAHVGAFVDYRYKGFTFSGLLGYTYSDYDSDRVVLGVNQTATSNTDSHQLLLAGQVAYEFLLDSEKTWSLTPILGFHFAHQMTDGYTESGAGAGNLTVEDTDAQSFQSKVGIEVSKTFLYQEGKRLTVFANGFYHHEFLDDGRDVNVAFNSAAVNAFTVQTEDPERDFANLGMGLESIPFSNPNLRFIGGYQYQFGQDSFTSHNVYAGGRYDF